MDKNLLIIIAGILGAMGLFATAVVYSENSKNYRYELCVDAAKFNEAELRSYNCSFG